MSKFDKEICWCNERKKFALEDIAEFGTGLKIHLDGKDMTSELLLRAKSDVEMFERLIAAYLERND